MNYRHTTSAIDATTGTIEYTTLTVSPSGLVELEYTIEEGPDSGARTILRTSLNEEERAKLAAVLLATPIVPAFFGKPHLFVELEEYARKKLA